MTTEVVMLIGAVVGTTCAVVVYVCIRPLHPPHDNIQDVYIMNEEARQKSEKVQQINREMLDRLHREEKDEWM